MQRGALEEYEAAPGVFRIGKGGPTEWSLSRETHNSPLAVFALLAAITNQLFPLVS